MPARKAQPQKRGAKGYFTGSRHEFLTGYCDEYVALRGKSRRQFWFELFNEWWRRYPWRLQDNEEPPTDDPKKMEELARVGPGDEKAKSTVEEKLRDRIVGWFGYRASLHNSHHEGGVWTPILKRIHQQSNPKPRCRSAFQQLMLEEPNVVNAAFVSLHGEARGMDQLERLNKRNEVARRLINSSYKHLAADLEKRAKENHERELKEWGLGLEGIGEAEDVQLARDTLCSAVHPLLKFIGGYSGCYATLLVAAPDPAGGKPYFSAVHHFPKDSAMRVNWTDFNKDAFKDGVVGPFFKYIHWMEGADGQSENTKPTLPGTASSLSTPPPPVPSITVSSTAVSSTAVSSAAISSTAVPTAQKSGKYKKRAFVYTEDDSEQEDDRDMDLGDNDSSGSSVDSDHVPAKRLRTSIVTRSSRTTPTSKEPSIEADDHQRTLSPSLDNSDTEPEVSNIGSSTNDLSSNTHADLANDATPYATPTPRHSTPASMDVDQSNTNPETNNVVDVGARELVNIPPVVPLQPPVALPQPPAETIPESLTGKYNIHAYLSEVKESGFQDLLKNYISFELTDRSNIRGALSTTNRPKAVGWWSGRSRPDRLPPYDSLKSFAASIVKWWIALQPSWRKIQPGEVSRVGGNWQRLYQPGTNGLLNVVVLAYWWAKILEQREIAIDGTYIWFISDVTWVLSELTDAARKGISFD